MIATRKVQGIIRHIEDEMKDKELRKRLEAMGIIRVEGDSGKLYNGECKDRELRIDVDVEIRKILDQAVAGSDILRGLLEYLGLEIEDTEKVTPRYRIVDKYKGGTRREVVGVRK